MRLIPALLAATLSLAAAAQQPAPAPPPAPPMTAVNPDGTITFRYSNAGAQQVVVETDATPKPLPMTKGENGVWTATTPPLKPEHYGYSFRVDGAQERDPLNHDIRPNIVGLYNDILVPGSVPQPWELQAIPHGNVTRHVYTTHTAQNLPGNQEAYMVYTPPNYDPKKPGGYPMLALLHGWSDMEVGWTAVGQANLILDSLIAQNKAVPMIVVMPLGYGDYTFVKSGHDVWQDPKQIDNNTNIYSDMLLGEILPQVQREYAVSTDPNQHAIAGLSMGGLESVTIGLNHPEVFRYVIGMSAALHQEHFDEHFPAFAGGNQQSFAHFKLLWIACGTEDGLITPNRHFVAWAKSRNLPVTAVETPGQHTWLVWRDNLITVAPLLFR
jgi:enterochelin esterase-like enzyme